MLLMRIAGIAAIAWTFAVTPATSKPPIPNYAAKVAEGQTRDGSWGIWMFGRDDAAQCWATRTIEDGFENESAHCGISVPARPWQLAARGSFGPNQSPESMLFFLTQRQVAELEIHLALRDPIPNQFRVKVHHLTAAAASRANLKLNFGYAVLKLKGSLACIRRVALFSKSGHRVGGTENPECRARQQSAMSEASGWVSSIVDAYNFF